MIPLLLSTACLTLLTIIIISSVKSAVETLYFPTTIPSYSIRIDITTNKTVETGLAHTFINFPEHDLWKVGNLREKVRKKYSLSEFKVAMQCAPDEPDLDTHTGSLSMLKLMPVQRETIEIMCVWAETRCLSLNQCHQALEGFRFNHPQDFGMSHFNGFQTFQLIRILNQTLYDDWPFDRSRLPPWKEWDKHLVLVEIVLAHIHDIPDSVFFMGTEQSFLPWKYPFPAFAPSARLGLNNMPWPWSPALHQEYSLYNTLLKAKQNFTFDSYGRASNQFAWEKRNSRAAYFGTFSTIRQFVFELARKYPNLVDTSFTLRSYMRVDPLEPTSPERDGVTSQVLQHPEEFKGKMAEINALPPGYALPLLKQATSRTYIPGRYKYVIVLLAMDGDATSGRLADLLAHSGAVILLQESPFRWHFSARLQPWVHYVPVSYSAADLARKVAWLQSHDKEAQQLAENARNFGRSYLRLEDYLCYAAHAMEALADTATDEAKYRVFNTTKLSGMSELSL